LSLADWIKLINAATHFSVLERMSIGAVANQIALMGTLDRSTDKSGAALGIGGRPFNCDGCSPNGKSIFVDASADLLGATFTGTNAGRVAGA
jgi:hypothetical protein